MFTESEMKEMLLLKSLKMQHIIPLTKNSQWKVFLHSSAVHATFGT